MTVNIRMSLVWTAMMPWVTLDFTRWERADDGTTGKGRQGGRLELTSMDGEVGGLVSGGEEGVNQLLPLPPA